MNLDFGLQGLVDVSTEMSSPTRRQTLHFHGEISEDAVVGAGFDQLFHNNPFKSLL